MVGSPIMARVLKARTMTPAQAALEGRLRNYSGLYNGRTCGKISTYKTGCRCAECKEACRLAGEKIRRKKGMKPRKVNQ